jgi:excisionase family DNA binding protein
MSTNDIQHDQFLRVPELCDLIAVKRATLYRLIKAGELNPIKLLGTTVFSKQQIIQWMKDKVEGK